MHILSVWFIRNPVAANLVVLLIIAGGILTAFSMRIEGFPKLPADVISIETLYADAYAGQVDRQVTQKIEKALEGLPGVKKSWSTSTEGYSAIHVQKTDGYDLQQLLDKVRMRMDGIANLPEEAEKSTITLNDFDFPALIVQLYGDTDTRTLQSIGSKVREELLALPEVSKLNIWGRHRPELSIELAPETLEKYELTTGDIAAKIQQSSLTFKAGTLKTKGGRISLRADNQAYFYNDFAQIPVIEKRDGTQIVLGELSEIKDGYVDDEVIVRFNGQAALGIEVLVGRQENVLNIAGAVKHTVAALQATLPDDVALSIWADSSHYIAERLSLLRNNALQGLVLVFVLLALFLNLKLAFWVAIGIPVSIAGALAVAGSKWIDYSLNDITTFGLIIALGILVDDAVVVGESVFEQRRGNNDPVVGTEKGLQRVAMATIYGVLTTVAALLPLLFLDNALGKVLASFSAVVLLTLLFSLFESKFILPAHLAQISLLPATSTHAVLRYGQKIQDVARLKLEQFKLKIYLPILIWSLQQRYAVFVLFLSFAVLGLGLVYTGKIKTVFFPEVPGQMIKVKVEMDARAPYSLTLDNANRIEQIANRLNDEYLESAQLNEKPIKDMLVVVNGPASVDIYAELSLPEKRSSLSTLDILKKWQKETGRLEGATQLSFSGSEETGGGFSIQLFSKDEASLKSASDQLMAYLENIDGVSNLRGELKNGKPELSIKLKPEARHLGFSNETVARQIGLRFGGAEAQRVQRDGEEVRVIVRNRHESRRSVESLMQTRLRSENGDWLPLLSVTSIESAYAADYITRRDGKRVNTIRAYIDKKTVAPSLIADQLFRDIVPDIQREFPQVTIKTAGEQEEIGNMKGGLVRALIFTCILIYALLAIPLKSYWQPFIIMSVIPFGFVGAAVGHLIMDLPLSLLSFFGMLALAGVVVNDSLVMVSRYNQAREDQNNIHDALIDAGGGRFRAIFLTTVTTVAGLTPLLRESSEQAQYLIPAATSLAFGEIFATTITLILVPVLLAIAIDVQVFFTRKSYPTIEEVLS